MGLESGFGVRVNIVSPHESLIPPTHPHQNNGLLDMVNSDEGKALGLLCLVMIGLYLYWKVHHPNSKGCEP